MCKNIVFYLIRWRCTCIVRIRLSCTVSVFIELARNLPGRAQLILPVFLVFRPHPRQGSVAPAWKHLLFGLLGVSWPPRVRRRPLGASPTFAATLLGSGTLWGAATPPVRPQRRVKVVSLRLATSQCQTTELSFIACIRGHYLAQAQRAAKHLRERSKGSHAQALWGQAATQTPDAFGSVC